MGLSGDGIIVIVTAGIIGLATLAFFHAKNNDPDIVRADDPVINEEVSAAPASVPAYIRDPGDEYRRRLNISNGRIRRGGVRTTKKKTSKKSRTKSKKRK